ncbi:hypothetical protein [Azospirillum palustre]|uniref:hypothetical protein n=1 Tax=Azospirillum palustre TaxID=2044885 RepID=UPI0011789DD8|nr:hypothetical protein [Azospirillum palustre]
MATSRLVRSVTFWYSDIALSVVDGDGGSMKLGVTSCGFAFNDWLRKISTNQKRSVKRTLGGKSAQREGRDA